MRVLLTTPLGIEKTELYRVLGIKAPPLGLAWIAAVLEKEGIDVKVIDAPTIGLSEQEFMRIVDMWSPDIVGITSLTPTIYLAYRTAEITKTVDPNIKVIIGGPHATCMWFDVLNECPYIDYVVVGEGEYTALELVKALERNGDVSSVKGIAFRNKNGNPVFTGVRPLIKDLNKLPLPARHLLPMDKYTLFGKPIRIAHIMASRGCPYGCAFCSTSYFFGRKVRFRSPELVAEEVEECVHKYRAKIIVFTDDEFTINHKWLLKFINELRERKLDIKWSCGSRVDTVNKDILRKMISSGCTGIYYGVESGSQEILNKIGKRITLKQAEDAIRSSKELGIMTVATFMLGLPWETIDDMKKTVNFALKLDPDYAQFTVATPYPGTSLFQIAKNDNLIVDWDWSHWTTLRPVMRGYSFTIQDVQEMLRYAYKSFYLRVRFLVRQLKRGVFRDILRILYRNLIKPSMNKLSMTFKKILELHISL